MILLNYQQQPENNNDETVSLYIVNRGKRIVTRNSVSQFGYEMAVTSYKTDSLGTSIDLDDIGV